MNADSNFSAPTKFLKVGNETYAYRRFGGGSGLPLLFLQHFTGTLDNWDPAVTDPLAAGREVILFESAGVGRSTGDVPNTKPGTPIISKLGPLPFCSISKDVLVGCMWVKEAMTRRND